MKQPLSSRVIAPSTVDIPVVDGTTWRPAKPADLDAITTMMHLADTVDHPDFLTPRSELAEDLESSFVDTDHDTLLGLDSDGEVMAYGAAIMPPGQETLVRSIVLGGVRPDWRGRGVGRQLLAWQEQRASQQLAASDSTLPGRIMSFVSEKSPWVEHLFDRAGFVVARHYFQLERVLADPIAEVGLSAGFTLVHPAEVDSELLRRAKNDSFRDHWGSQPVSEEEWHAFRTSPIVRDDLSWIVLASNGDVAGFVLTTVNEDDWPGQGFSSGYIDLVGTPRAYRGRGIAPAMLVATLRSIRDAGLERAVLDVDSESLTGALGLYTGVGFVKAGRSSAVIKEY